jgi:hypothetical protein
MGGPIVSESLSFKKGRQAFTNRTAETTNAAHTIRNSDWPQEEGVQQPGIVQMKSHGSRYGNSGHEASSLSSQ